MRIKSKVNVRIAEDTSMKDLLFALDDTGAEEVIDTFFRMTGGKVKLDASATEAMALGDITAVKGLFIKLLDGDADVNINGLGVIPLERSGTATGTSAKLFWEGSLTSVSLTNKSGTTALNAIYAVWGDTTP